ncbi:MAG: DUF192 domain-containing protein [Burkholderiaceae bacterium]
MKLVALYRQDQCLLPRVWHAISPWERTRGLLGRPALQAGEGMLIGDCRIVHTVGMRYDLDLAFLDRRGQVRKLVKGLPSMRVAGSMPACATLELAAGTLTAIDLKVGDYVTWQEAA